MSSNRAFVRPYSAKGSGSMTLDVLELETAYCRARRNTTARCENFDVPGPSKLPAESDEDRACKPYYLDLEKHSCLNKSMLCMRLLLFASLCIGCAFQLKNLTERYLGGVTTFHSMIDRLANQDAQLASNKDPPSLYEPFPSVTVCAPSDSVENWQLKRLSILEISQAFKGLEPFALNDSTEEFLYEYRQAWSNPRYFLDWLMFCELTPYPWPYYGEVAGQPAACDPRLVDISMYPRENVACLTFKVKPPVSSSLTRLELTFLLGQQQQTGPTISDQTSENPFLVEELIQSTKGSLQVSVGPQNHWNSELVGAVASGRQMNIYVERSSRQTQNPSSIFMPGANVLRCRPNDAKLVDILQGGLVKKFLKTKFLCEQLMEQQRMRTACGCLDPNLAVPVDPSGEYIFCYSLKSVVAGGFQQSHMRKEISNEACLQECEEQELFVTSDQIALTRRLHSTAYFSVMKQLKALNDVVKGQGRESLAQQQILVDSETSLPTFVLDNFAKISVELSNKESVQTTVSYSYTFDFLIADVGGTLGLWIDWTVVGFFESYELLIALSMPLVVLCQRIRRRRRGQAIAPVP